MRISSGGLILLSLFTWMTNLIYASTVHASNQDCVLDNCTSDGGLSALNEDPAVVGLSIPRISPHDEPGTTSSPSDSDPFSPTEPDSDPFNPPEPDPATPSPDKNKNNPYEVPDLSPFAPDDPTSTTSDSDTNATAMNLPGSNSTYTTSSVPRSTYSSTEFLAAAQSLSPGTQQLGILAATLIALFLGACDLLAG